MKIQHWILSSNTDIESFLLRDSTLSSFSNNIFCWFAWSLIFFVARYMLDAWHCMNFVWFVLYEMHQIWFFWRIHVKMHEICLNINFWFCYFWRMHIWMHEFLFFSFISCIYGVGNFEIWFFLENACLKAWNLICVLF